MVITHIFSDIGGVLGTNGWDHNSRRLAAEHYHLDYELFEERHEPMAEKLDNGSIDVPEYVAGILSAQKNSPTIDEFVDFMRGQSKPYSETIEIFVQLSMTNRYFMAALNNESLLLNGYRIRKFGLKSIFQAFFSSCYMAARKPAPEIYNKVLDILQIAPEKCLFVDDRPENLAYPITRGMNVIQFQDAEQLRRKLKDFEIPIASQAIK
jgi:putative hydrolase of the HAD superfamily